MAGLSHIVAAVAVVLVAMCHASEALKLQLDPGMKKVNNTTTPRKTMLVNDKTLDASLLHLFHQCLGQDLTEDTLVVGNYHLFGVQSGPTATEIKVRRKPDVCSNPTASTR